MKRTHVCSHPGCGHLSPCPVHSRPASAPWSKHRQPGEGRQRAELKRARIALVGREACEVCGSTDRVVLHHERGVQLVPKLEHTKLLCHEHHRAVDHWAR